MDLSKYLALRSCADVHGKVNVHSSFHDDLFHVDPTDECSFKVWGGYRVSVYDEGRIIRVVLNDGAGQFKKVADRLQIPHAPRVGVADVEKSVNEGGIEILVNFIPESNGEGRIQNKDRIYAAVKHKAIKPLLAAVYSAEQYST